jgi:hypothetical protein
MATLLDLPDRDLAPYAKAVTGSEAASFAVRTPPIGIEDADVTLGLVAMRDTDVLAETRLTLVTRLTGESSVHLWSDTSRALTASVTIHASEHKLAIQLRFAPAGRPATVSAEDALFLRAAGSSTHITLRLPDGHLSGDRLPVPAEMTIDEASVRLLTLMADVARRSGADFPVPETVTDELLTDLVVASRLLHGESVRGTWHEGAIPLDRRSQIATIDRTQRHELMMVGPRTLTVSGIAVPLGDVRQVYSDAEIDDIVDVADGVVLRVRAHGGEAASMLSPVPAEEDEINPHVVLAPPAFDELVDELGRPARHGRLHQLL